MARPKTPLLTRRSVVAATLQLLETEGAEALSVRRLADQLHVNAASLYHHFESKDDILRATVRAALAEIHVEEFDESRQSWIDWASDVGLEHRRFLISRGYMIPLMMQGVVAYNTLPFFQALHRELIRHHVDDPDDRSYILDSLEAFIAGSALMRLRAEGGTGGSGRSRRPDPEEERAYVAAHRALLEHLVTHFAAAPTKRPRSGRVPAPT